MAAVAARGADGTPAVTLRWNNTPRVTRYVIRRKLGEGIGDTIHRADAHELSFRDDRVTPGGTYS